jgi:hypothetical protein
MHPEEHRGETALSKTAGTYCCEVLPVVQWVAGAIWERGLEEEILPGQTS